MGSRVLPCGSVRFEVLGSGRPLVFLHGLLGCGAQWRPAAERLASAYTCWLLELPGISASRATQLSLPGLAIWLEQALTALEIDTPAIVGSSWGGALALQHGVGAPGLRLVLAAPVHPFWMPSRRQRCMLNPLATRAGAWLGARVGRGTHRALLGRMYGDERKMRESSVDEYGAILRQRGLGAAVAGYARRWRRDLAGLRAQLGRRTGPALLLWGSRDGVVPAATAAPLHAALPGSQLEILPGLGHLPHAEDPAGFAERVLRFLQ